MGFSLVVVSGDCSLFAVCGLLIGVASLVADHGLWGMWVSVVAHLLLGRWIIYH